MSIEIKDDLVEKTSVRVMEFFKEISAIPRGSGKEQAIATYLTKFAEKNGLEFKCSKQTINGKQTYDVIIKKPAAGSDEYKKAETVILQSHIDMVWQKTKDSKHNFETDPITFDDKAEKIISDRGTTLGADDGIGVACMLAILESDTIAHPKIEALFTSDEEDGMTGAMAVDCELVTGKRLINIDTESEGTLYYGCAGGLDAIFHLPVTHEPVPGKYTFLQLELTGLHGGHSGVEIHRGYANAHKLMARTLRAICDTVPALLVSFTGGDKRNVITQDVSALLAVPDGCTDKVKVIVKEYTKTFKHEYEGIEELEDDKGEKKEIQLNVETVSSDKSQALSGKSLDQLLSMILVMPNDIQAMHGKVPGLVETSCNLGIVRQEPDHFYLCSLIRSFYRTKKLYVLEQMRQLAHLTGAAFSFGGDYPDWEPNPESELIKRFKKAYSDAFDGKEPKVESIHAGLECGYFSEKFKDMDMIACGPTITGAHTPKETLDAPSTKKVVKLLLTVLSQMDAPAPVLAKADVDCAVDAHTHTHICQCVR